MDAGMELEFIILLFSEDRIVFKVDPRLIPNYKLLLGSYFYISLIGEVLVV